MKAQFLFRKYDAQELCSANFQHLDQTEEAAEIEKEKAWRTFLKNPKTIGKLEEIVKHSADLERNLLLRINTTGLSYTFSLRKLMTENKGFEKEYNSLEQYNLPTFVQAYLQNVYKVGYGKVALDKVNI